jgi:hypothetical protein
VPGLVRRRHNHAELTQWEKLAALVPPPRVHQVRSNGGLAAHSTLRGVITSLPHRQDVEAQANPVSSA